MPRKQSVVLSRPLSELTKHGGETTPPDAQASPWTIGPRYGPKLLWGNFFGTFCGLGDVRYDTINGGGVFVSGVSVSDNAIIREYGTRSARRRRPVGCVIVAADDGP